MKSLIHALNKEIVKISLDQQTTYQYIADKIGDAHLVLLGESTHGTHEFYQARIELCKYLILKKGFQAIAIEGDWTSAYPVNQYLQGKGDISESAISLAEFNRFPVWMWRNKTSPPFLQWIRQYNDNLQFFQPKIGFYGLDLYCLNSSIKAVINYLNKNDPIAATKAIQRYACFDHATVDPQNYGYLVGEHLKKSCVREVTEELLDMQRIAFDKFHQNPFNEAESLFYAAQNARVVKNAELYYRALFESREKTWNICDQHMAETLQNLISHLELKSKKPAKIIIWAHNSHVGDARATEMSERQEINLGQIVREKFSTMSFHLGFSTYSGTVTAANEWGAPGEQKNIIPGMPGSYEALFHELQFKDFILDLHSNEHLTHLLQPSRLQRAIGVIYSHTTERFSHYFFTKLPYQFDALIHIDKSNAIESLDR